MSVHTCKHGVTAPKEAIEGLPGSQEMTGRHKCTTCAFRSGARWMLDQIARRGHVPFMCDDCGLLSREPKWHCETCHQHSPPERESCVHCGAMRRLA